MEFLQMTSKEFREKFIDPVKKPQKSGNKYKNIRVETEEGVFDSKKELRRWNVLNQMQLAGQVMGLERQKAFLLIEPFEYMGKKVRGTSWIADFYYYSMEKGCWVAEDVKSDITKKKPEYRIKVKLFMKKYPEILFREEI